MDKFTFLIAIVLIAMAFQFGETWLVFGIAGLLIIASRDLKAIVLMIVAVAALYWLQGIGMREYWLAVVIGLVALSFLLGVGGEEKEQPPPLMGDFGFGGY